MGTSKWEIVQALCEVGAAALAVVGIFANKKISEEQEENIRRLVMGVTNDDNEEKDDR